MHACICLSVCLPACLCVCIYWFSFFSLCITSLLPSSSNFIFLFAYLLLRDVALIKIIGDMDIDCDYNYSYSSSHFCYNELCYSIFLLLLFSKTNLFSILLLSFRIQGYSSMGVSYLDQLEILLTINSVDCLHQYQNQCHVRTYYFIDHRITLFCHICQSFVFFLSRRLFFLLSSSLRMQTIWK